MSDSEFDIISKYFTGAGWQMSDQVVLGPGDDCAILDVPTGEQLVVSTDSLVEGVHFPAGFNPGLIASRALRVNLSDLAAMGAKPLACTLALNLPAVDESWLSHFSRALQQETEMLEIPLTGGNIAQGPLTVTLQVLGTVEAGRAIRRDSAAIGDDVYVTGALGEGAGGLIALEQQLEAAELIRAYASPASRITTGRRLSGYASAAIDVSDGLVADLGHIADASGLGAELLVKRIPVSETLRKLVGDEQAWELALTGGDDYELCFTAPTSLRKEILSRDFGVMVTRIGEMTSGQGIQFSPPDFTLKGKSGYQHF